jgi:crotonobetainyl-CoA:carnitine CoA-transferase CaiB-like acyl-CoA transferase
LEHPTEGKVTNCRYPITFSRSPASVRRLAPNLGEHNSEVLRERPA